MSRRLVQICNLKPLRLYEVGPVMVGEDSALGTRTGTNKGDYVTYCPRVGHAPEVAGGLRTRCALRVSRAPFV